MSEIDKKIVIDSYIVLSSKDENNLDVENKQNIIKDNENHILKDIIKDVIKENENPVIKDIIKDIIKENENPVIKDIIKDIIKETDSIVIKDTDSIVVKENENPVIKDVIKENENPVIKDVIKDNDNVVIKEEFNSHSNNEVNNIINNLIDHMDVFKNKFRIDNETIFDNLQDIKKLIEDDKKKENLNKDVFTPLEIVLLEAIKKSVPKEIEQKIEPSIQTNNEDAKIEDVKIENVKIEDDKTEDDKTEDDKTEDDKTEDGKIEDDKTEDDKTEDDKTEDDKTEDDKIEDDKIEDDKRYKELCKEKNEIQDTLLKLVENEKNNENIINLNEFNTIKNKIYNHLKIIISSKSINSNNIVYILTELMKFIEIFKIKGVDKKTIILSTLRKFLIDENYDSDKINFIIDTICNELIDIFISIDKRKITIRKNVSCFVPWCN